MADDRVATSPVVLPKTFVQTFRRAASLADDKLKAINAWAKSHQDLLLAAEPDFGVAESLGMGEQQFLNAYSVIFYFLYFSESKGPDLGRFIQTLRSQGLADLAETARILLDGITVDPSKVEYMRQKSLATQSVLPTIGRVDAVCDLRGVFRGFPSPNVSNSHIERTKALLGFEPIAIISVTVNDAAGQDHVSVFQCTRRVLQNLLDTLHEAAEQMERIALDQPIKSEGDTP